MMLAPGANSCTCADEAMYLVKNTTRDNIALAGEGIIN